MILVFICLLINEFHYVLLDDSQILSEHLAYHLVRNRFFYYLDVLAREHMTDKS